MVNMREHESIRNMLVEDLKCMEEHVGIKEKL